MGAMMGQIKAPMAQKASGKFANREGPGFYVISHNQCAMLLRPGDAAQINRAMK
jgi:hypothetical protein